jgi:ABC-type sugar transport system ATPase subunit
MENEALRAEIRQLKRDLAAARAVPVTRKPKEAMSAVERMRKMRERRKAQ